MIGMLARFLFWLVVGGMLGFGGIAVLSIGAPFLLAGLVLLAVGGKWLGFRGAWAVLIGLGAVPAVVLGHEVLTAPPSCAGSMQPGQQCEEIPAAWSLTAVACGCIALAGVLAPLIRARARLALTAAVASGITLIVASVRPIITPIPNGEHCIGSGTTGMHCTTLFSPSLLSQGDVGGIAIILGCGVAAAMLIVGLTFIHVRFPRRQSVVALWVLIAVILWMGLLYGTAVSALPGILAVLAGLAASGCSAGGNASHPPSHPLGRWWLRVEPFLPGGGT